MVARRASALALAAALAAGCYGGSAGDSLPLPTDLPVGEARFVREADGVLVVAHDVARADLLARLGAWAGFPVEGSGSLQGRWTGAMRADSLVDAVAGLLGTVPFRAEYQADRDGHRLVRVRLGALPVAASLRAQPASAAAAAAVAEPVVAQARTELDVPPPSATDLAHWRDDHPFLEELLAGGSPAERIVALEGVQAEGAGLAVLDAVLAAEPDPLVRIALLHKLDESGSVVALQSLLSALDDANPDVVVTAVRLVADWQDLELMERYLEPLLNHASGEVQQAAMDAINTMR